MASKAMLFLLATLLLLTTKISHGDTIPVVNPKPSPPYIPKPVVNPPPPVTTVPPPLYTPPPVSVPPPVVSVPPTPTYNPPPAAPVTPPTLPPIKSLKECGPLCDTRCSLHSRKNVCQRACLTCCYRCKCVPPGTYGNHDMCGTCYSRMKTSRDRLKCP